MRRRSPCPASPPLVVSLVLLLLTAFEEILPPGYEPAELVLMNTTGYLGVQPDTIRIDMDQRLHFTSGRTPTSSRPMW